MGNFTVELPPPMDWQDFERLSLDVFRHKWKDEWAERHGRGGQEQSGVDIRGFLRETNQTIGVQCKKKRIKNESRAGSSLTKGEVLAEARKAANFGSSIDVFVMATTGQRDAALQTQVNVINDGKEFSFRIVLWFWDDFVAVLNENRDLLYRYYENVLKYREEYDPQEHFLRLLAMAFDRPAIRTPLHSEGRATDLEAALSGVMEAVATGVLKDREGRVIDECRRPTGIARELQYITKKLQVAKSLVSDGLSSGRIIEHPTCTEVRDHELARRINEARRQAVDHLNGVLATRNREPLVWDGAFD